VSQSRDDLYQQAATEFGDALDRLVRAYELDFDKRRDLLQEIHLALWRSFEKFEARCSLRTWVYRIAHNIATSHVIRQRRMSLRLLSVEEIDSMPDQDKSERDRHDRLDIERLLQLIHQLNPPDREIMLLYLEGLDGSIIGEIMEISPVNVRSKVHRIKAIIARRFLGGEEQQP
jgi:RNA polymerase sigma-70 factor, ECF subfamily